MFFKHALIIIVVIFIAFQGTVAWGQVKGKQLRLQLESTDSVSSRILKSYASATQFKDFQSLKAAKDSLTKSLTYAGYLDLTTSPLDKLNDSVYTTKYTLHQITKAVQIVLPPNARSEKFLWTLGKKTNDSTFIINYRELKPVLRVIANHFSESGHPFSTINLNTISKQDSTLTTNLQLKKSTERLVDSIIIKGYAKFPKAFLKHYGEIRRHKKFNKTELIERSKRLNNLAFCVVPKNPEVLFTPNKTAVYLYLKKKQANNFDGILGFSTNEQSQKLTFDGYLNLNLINNLNLGETLIIGYKSDKTDQQNFSIETKAPYIFNTPVGIEAAINLFKKDSTFLTSKQNLQFTYRYKNILKTAIGYELQNSTILRKNTTATIPFIPFNSTFITTQIAYVKRSNSTLSPIKSEITLATGFGKRDSKGSQIPQIKLNTLVKHVLNLNKRNSIYIANKSAFLATDEHLPNELFRFGGINSMRGFEENNLFASLFTSTMTEYRYLLTSTFYIHSIMDLAYFEDPTSDSENNLIGIGFGIALNTKSGLFKFNLANGKSNSQTFKFSNSKVHFSITANF